MGIIWIAAMMLVALGGRVVPAGSTKLLPKLVVDSASVLPESVQAGANCRGDDVVRAQQPSASLDEHIIINDKPAAAGMLADLVLDLLFANNTITAALIMPARRELDSLLGDDEPVAALVMPERRQLHFVLVEGEPVAALMLAKRDLDLLCAGDESMAVRALTGGDVDLAAAPGALAAAADAAATLPKREVNILVADDELVAVRSLMEGEVELVLPDLKSAAFFMLTEGEVDLLLADDERVAVLVLTTGDVYLLLRGDESMAALLESMAALPLLERQLKAPPDKWVKTSKPYPSPGRALVRPSATPAPAPSPTFEPTSSPTPSPTLALTAPPIGGPNRPKAEDGV